jgi:hypothetical protein
VVLALGGPDHRPAAVVVDDDGEIAVSLAVRHLVHAGGRGAATGGRVANVRLVHLPVHASWLNQAEIYFSVVQRKVFTPNDFADLGEVEQRLLGFERRYEEAAKPFEWKFTREDLALLMKRLGAKDDLRPAV